MHTVRQLAALADGTYDAGEHTVRWNGRNVAGRRLGPGLYFVRMWTADFEAVNKVMVIR